MNIILGHAYEDLNRSLISYDTVFTTIATISIFILGFIIKWIIDRKKEKKQT